MTPDTLAAAYITQEADRGAADFRAFLELAWAEIESNPLRLSWHMHAIADHLSAVSRGEIRNLVICVPPGASKSLLASTLWPAWDWIQCPTRRFLAATYGQELSDKNAKLHRDLVLSDWYQARWGNRVRIGPDDVAKVREFKLESKGWRISTSIGGRATGLHADIHIGDDLAKAQDAEGRNYLDPQAIEKANQFWFGAMATRRADAATLARVMIAQRLHHDDTPGKCIDRGYTALVLPMEYDPARPCKTVVWWRAPGAQEPSRFADPRARAGQLLIPSRFPREVVDADRKSNPLQHEAQNQQNPTPREGAIFKHAGRNRWTELPTKNVVSIITVDCAFKGKETSDFVAVQVWLRHGTDFYLAERHLERTGITGTIRRILDVKSRWPQAGIHIEDKANGPAVIEMLKSEISGVCEWSPGQDSKVSRAEAVAHLFDAGNVWLPPDSAAPWIGEYLATMGRFPLVKHDDDVDGTTMALLILHVPRATSYAAMVAAMKRP